MRPRIAPYLHRLGLTAGQAWTLAIGLVLGAVLIAVSVPPVWERRAGPAVPPATVLPAPAPTTSP